MPPINGGQSSTTYDNAVLTWLNDRIGEGMQAIQSEPSYKELDRMIAYIMGDQLDPRRPSGLSAVTVNQLKNILLQSVSAITDVHPLFGFKTKNTTFHKQSELLTNLTQAWWVNNFCDVKLGDVLRYALLCCGYCEVHWDQSAAEGMGDILLSPRDPRDVLPIRATYGQSVQDWEGVILCETMSLDKARARWPYKRIEADNSGAFTQKVWKTLSMLLGTSSTTPGGSSLFGNRPRKAPKAVPTVDVFTTYVKDRRLHQGAAPVKLGEEGTNWEYTVYPIGWQKPDGTVATEKDARLFPRGRLIIATRSTVLYDGPNPYWHGMFPIAKLSLDPWPWSLWGTGLVKDLLPLQDAVNEVTNGILDMVRKVLRPGLVGDKDAVPDSLWARLDTRIPGLKIKTNTSRGKTLELEQPPNLPPYVFDFLQFMMGQANEMAGVANLQALTQLQQAPGSDTIESMKEALTPILRLKGRLMEAFLRDIGEMVKGCFFQFYTAPRRVSILGEQGLDLADFDFDPGNLIPSMQQGMEGYTAQLDSALPLNERAAFFMPNFAFQVTPNSLLAVSQMSRKLLYLQLWRGGLMDPWTLGEVLEVPNMGSPPAGAESIVDRLVAAMQMGLVGNVSPAGRKATGQESPEIKSKDGGSRQTVSESG